MRPTRRPTREARTKAFGARWGVSLLAGVALALLAAERAPAQEPAPEVGAAACRFDALRLCRESFPGQEAYACLIDNESELSPKCRAHLGARLAEARSGFASVAESCAGDIETHCADVEPGGGRLGDCLKDHAGALSQACRDATGITPAEEGGGEASGDAAGADASAAGEAPPGAPAPDGSDAPAR